MKLTELQIRVLSELAHMRVLPDDAILPTKRLEQLLRRRNLYGVLRRLEKRGYLERPEEDPLSNDLWRITAEGRQALSEESR